MKKSLTLKTNSVIYASRFGRF